MRKPTAAKRYPLNKLVALKKILDDHAKADILLVRSRFKPAAMIELSHFAGVKFSRSEFHKRAEVLEKILREMKLDYQLNFNYPKNRSELTRYSYVARNRKMLEKLKAADAEKNIRKRRLKLGSLLGYPPTAVNAFAKGKALNRQITDQMMKKSNDLKFLNFRLSKHWQKELRYVKKRAEAIEKISPKLYKKIRAV